MVNTEFEVNPCLFFLHDFSLLPQAFTTDFRVHWAQHPLRPEFAESTYFLYKVRSVSFLFWLLFLAPRIVTELQHQHKISSLSSLFYLLEPVLYIDRTEVLLVLKIVLGILYA